MMISIDKNKKGFTLAETMIVILVIAMILIAFMPIVTRRKIVVDNLPWKWLNNGSDIYSGAERDQSVMIGHATRVNNKSKLYINQANSGNPLILFKELYIDHDNSPKYRASGSIYLDYTNNVFAIGTTKPNNGSLGYNNIIISPRFDNEYSKNTSSEGNVYLGYKAGYSTNKNSDYGIDKFNTAIGYQAHYGAFGIYNTAIGENALGISQTSNKPYLGYNTAIGNNAGSNYDSKEKLYNTYIGNNVTCKFPDSGSSYSCRYNTILGENIGVTPVYGEYNSIILPSSAILNAVGGNNIKNYKSYNTLWGVSKISSESDYYGRYNTVIGSKPCQIIGGGDYSISIGNDAITDCILNTNTNNYYYVSGSYNIVFGSNSGSLRDDYQYSCVDNVTIGNFAGNSIGGDYNTIIGYNAGSNIGGDYNVVYGKDAGNNISSDFNIAVGAGSRTTSSNANAGYGIAIGNGTNAQRDYDIAIGHAAKTSNNETAGYNISIGANCENASGQNNVCISSTNDTFTLPASNTAGNSIYFGNPTSTNFELVYIPGTLAVGGDIYIGNGTQGDFVTDRNGNVSMIPKTGNFMVGGIFPAPADSETPQGLLTVSNIGGPSVENLESETNNDAHSNNFTDFMNDFGYSNFHYDLYSYDFGYNILDQCALWQQTTGRCSNVTDGYGIYYNYNGDATAYVSDYYFSKYYPQKTSVIKQKNRYNDAPSILNSFYLFGNYGNPASDIRLKNIIGENKDGLDKILQLQTYKYIFKKDKSKTLHVGVIAQELQKIFPNAVKKGEDGYLTIRYEDMLYGMVNAIKELDKMVQDILGQIKTAWQTLTDIDARLNTIEADNKDMQSQIADIDLKLKHLEQQ